MDLIFWDTTTLYGEIDDEDEEEQWRTRMLPALRKRHNKEGRANNPQVVVVAGPSPAMGCRCARGCFLAIPRL